MGKPDKHARALDKLERTDWFEGSQRPVRDGVYERKYGMGMSMTVLYCYWDGLLNLWACAGLTPEAAHQEWQAGLKARKSWLAGTPAAWVAPRQRLPWRGLARPAHDKER